MIQRAFKYNNSIRSFLLIFSICINCSDINFLHSQGFNQNYGVFELGWYDIAGTIEVVEDSIYVYYTDQGPTYGSRSCVANISQQGDLIWSKCLQMDSTFLSSKYNSVEYNEEADKFIYGGSIVTPNTEDESDLDFLSHVILFDHNLDSISTKILGDINNPSYILQARFANDEGYILSGHITDNSFEGIRPDLLLIKLDSQFNIEWQTSHDISNNSFDTGTSVVTLENGNFIVGGFTGESVLDAKYPIISLFNSEGEFISHHEFSNNSYRDFGARINTLSDGNFILSTTLKLTDEEDTYRIVKFDQDLNIIWDKTHSLGTHSCGFYQVKESDHGGYIGIGVQLDSENHDFGNILKFDEEGELEWSRLYQHADEGWLQNNRLYDVVNNPYDGGYVACGERQGIDGSQDYWVIKVDSMGCLVEGCDTLTGVQNIEELMAIEVLIGPIPTNDILQVTIPSIRINNLASHLSYSIYDLEGKEVKAGLLSDSDITYVLDVSDISKGIFLFSLCFKDEAIYSQKFIKR